MARLDESDVDADPIRQFEHWFQDAVRAEVPEPNAMTLATATPDGTPSARIVLLKGFDERGFTFFTDYRSHKASDIAANPRVALVFFWHDVERQVRISGRATRVERSESKEYFRSRPVGSQHGAWTSQQSSVIASRGILEARYAAVAAEFAGREVPLPSHWGGYRVAPESLEFWQGRESRLHDRLRYVLHAGLWRVERLSP